MSEHSNYIYDPVNKQWVYLGGSNTAKLYYGTTAHWNAQKDYISQKYAIYVYTDNPMVAKIGDGSTYLIDLPFINRSVDELKAEIETHIQDESVHVSKEDRKFWNEKTRVETEVTDETLVLTNL